MSYPFKNVNDGGISYVVPKSTMNIPAGYAPVNPGTYTIKYGASDSKSFTYAYLQAGEVVTGKYTNLLWSVTAPKVTPPPAPTPSVPVPAKPVVQTTSNGGMYKSTNGSLLSLPSGTVIPDGWTLYNGTETLYKFTDGKNNIFVGVGDGITIPQGFYPVDPGSYQIRDFDKSGMSFSIYTIPSDSMTVQGYNATLTAYSGSQNVNIPINPGDAIFTPSEVDTGTAAEAAGIDPDVPGTIINFNPGASTINGSSSSGNSFSNNIPWELISSVIGIIGIAGISYVGYLYITNPRGFKAYAEHMHEITGLIIDTGYAILILSVIAALSFVGYEFFNAYNETGTVPGALAKLTKDAIETFVSAIVVAIEGLVKDAWTFVWGEVQSVVPSWL